MDRPPYVKLVLVTPYMGSKGGDEEQLVRMCQQALPDVTVDGRWGPECVGSAQSWQWRVGSPRVDGILDTMEIRYLLKNRFEPDLSLPEDWQARAKQRAGTFQAGSNVRLQAVKLMESWAEEHWHEATGHNDPTPLTALGKKLGVPGWQADDGFAWCAKSTSISNLASGGRYGAEWKRLGFNGCYVPSLVAYAREGLHGLKVVGRSVADRGDLVIMNFDGGVDDHVGRLRSAPGRQSQMTVEGNTGPGESGSQNNGDGVYKRVRPHSVVTHYLRDS